MLPVGVSEEELHQFVRQALRSPWARLFGRGARIKTTNILKITDQETRSVEYHGVVDIEPVKSALMAAKRLRRLKFRGRELEVRPYHYRSRNGEQRGQKPLMEDLSIHNRRLTDRRRARLQKERVPVVGELHPGEPRIIPLLDESQVVEESGT
jgi:hypothetical protein